MGLRTALSVRYAQVRFTFYSHNLKTHMKKYCTEVQCMHMALLGVKHIEDKKPWQISMS